MADDQKHALSSAIRHEEDVVDPTKAKADHEKNQGDEDVDPAIARYSPAEQRKILQRVDFRILPIVCALYFISLMDRTNLGAANIAGMARDLHLSEGMRYSIITLAFFPPYIVFELPSTVLIRWIGPRIHLSSICMTWGLLLIGMGYTHDWKVMAGLRAILGFLEAGFFPGCLYFLSTWYTRYQMHKRYAIWYLSASISAAFAGILCYGLMQMDGINGLAGWRWIFIMQGVITCLVALISYALMVGFPDSKKRYFGFLDDDEVAFVLARINHDRQDAEQVEKFNFRTYMSHGLDWKIWGFSIIFCMAVMVGYSFAYFLPIILQGKMGFSVAASQCLVTPPYVAAGIWMYFTGWLGDKYKKKAPILLVNGLMACVGLPIMAFTDNVGAQYFGAFLTVIGVNSNLPTAMSYQANNIRGHWKRAFTSAIFVGMGGVGGIAGSLVFRSQDAPRYLPGIYACLASQVIILIMVILMTLKFMADNKKQAAGHKVIEGLPGFRYTV